MVSRAAEEQVLKSRFRTAVYDLMAGGSEVGGRIVGDVYSGGDVTMVGLEMDAVVPATIVETGTRIEISSSSSHPDMYIMSDIFENSHVAAGAARMTVRALQEGAIVWCFAQSDRAHREVYLKELKQLLLPLSVQMDDNSRDSYYHYNKDLMNLKWRDLYDDDDEFLDAIANEKLILWDVDEETVQYT